MILFLSREERELVDRLRRLENATDLTGKVAELKRQIVDLEIQKGKIEETHAREDRELRHMIGLEKKRQEVEIEQAKRETSLKVREENLVADRKRFEEQLAFNSKRYETMETYLKEMMADILARLPNINAQVSLRRK